MSNMELRHRNEGAGEGEEAKEVSTHEVEETEKELEKEEEKKKKEKKKDMPLSFQIPLFIFGGGQLVFIFVHMVVWQVLVNTIGEDSTVNLSNLYLDPSSSLSSLVSTVQFLFRLNNVAFLTVFALGIGIIIPLLVGLFVFGYFLFQAGDKKGDIPRWIKSNVPKVALWAGGIVIGWLITPTLQYYLYDQMLAVSLIGGVMGAIGLQKFADDHAEKIREQQKSKLRQMAEGEAGASVQLSSDGTTVADVAKVVDAIDRVRSKDNEEPPLSVYARLASHTVLGMAYGSALYYALYICFYELLLVPAYGLVTDLENQFVWKYLWYGAALQ